MTMSHVDHFRLRDFHACGTLMRHHRSSSCHEWMFILPILVSLAAGTYKWVQLPETMGKEVSAAIYYELDPFLPRL